MPRYAYCLVENTYVVRYRGMSAQYLAPDGSWVDYPDMWDVTQNGRPLADEAEARATAQWLFARDPDWWAAQERRRKGS